MLIKNMQVKALTGMAAPWNPRKIKKHDLNALRKSMKTFGVVEPIILNMRSSHIVGGHQRVLAAQAEGIETLPVVEVDLDAWEIVRRFSTDAGPDNVEVTSDGKKLLVSYKTAAAVGIWDLETGVELARIPSSRRVTHGVAISSDARYGFVSCSPGRSMVQPTVRPPASFAPRFAASMMPGPPPVITVKPASAR